MTTTPAPDRFHLDDAAQRWMTTHSWNRPTWTVAELTEAKAAAGQTVSVVLPALDEEDTVGAVVDSIAPMLGGL
ncbi:MAG TPA: glucosyl-3-phosphoglycerate synthase, partial [Mycobacterium sp.]|nr:glucosyl-3-phosphoglycerate synthase [Mycobacterium sp.]